MNDLKSHFDFDTDRTLLKKGNAELQIMTNTCSGTGKVWLELFPRPGIYFYGDFNFTPSEQTNSILNGLTDNTQFLFDNNEIKGFSVKSTGDILKGTATIKWCPEHEPVCTLNTDPSNIKYIDFHIFNFVNFSGSKHSVETQHSTSKAINILNLKCDKWNIELKSLFSTDVSFKSLNESGGYQLTHIGRLTSSSDNIFQLREGKDALTALRFFLSLAKGGWCNPICAIGYDSNSNRIAELWSSPEDLWHTPKRWFDERHANQLELLFPLFMDKWHIEE